MPFFAFKIISLLNLAFWLTVLNYTQAGFHKKFESVPDSLKLTCDYLKT
jgi:hypothetical protein